jgi:hypothetical protein
MPTARVQQLFPGKTIVTCRGSAIVWNRKKHYFLDLWDIALKYNREHIHDIIGWDKATWSRALRVWDEVIPERAKTLSALELGAGRGNNPLVRFNSLLLFFSNLGCSITLLQE